MTADLLQRKYPDLVARIKDKTKAAERQRLLTVVRLQLGQDAAEKVELSVEGIESIRGLLGALIKAKDMPVRDPERPTSEELRDFLEEARRKFGTENFSEDQLWQLTSSLKNTTANQREQLLQGLLTIRNFAHYRKSLESKLN